LEHAAEKGAVGYIDDGHACWSAAHVADVAKLYALVLDDGKRGARYHAVAEEGVKMRDIAQILAAGLGVPTVSISAAEAPAYFGWLSMFAGLDMLASSDWTRQQLGWQPTGPGLLADLEAMDYSRFATSR
jgi:nucleoside-diphosphate-sugar epimerase